MGTPDAILAREMPMAMSEIVPTMLNTKTTSAIAILLENFVLRSTNEITLSKYREIATESPNRKGRTTLLKTKNPAYTARNGFH
jgi:hypothetical protein